jgi:hypothetical protein
MMAIVFSGAKLISLQALPSGARLTQEYFINTSIRDIVHERGQIFRRGHRGAFFVHMIAILVSPRSRDSREADGFDGK